MNELTLTQQVERLSAKLEDLCDWLDRVNEQGTESIQQLESAIESLQNQITAVQNRIG